MEERNNGAKDQHSVVLWILLGKASACTCYHSDITECLFNSRHHYTLVFCVLTLGQPILAPWLSQHLLKAFGPGRCHEGKSPVLSLLISPISFTKVMKLHLIYMSPSWLLPQASEYRPHALVLSGYLILISVF